MPRPVPNDTEYGCNNKRRFPPAVHNLTGPHIFSRLLAFHDVMADEEEVVWRSVDVEVGLKQLVLKIDFFSPVVVVCTT
jgi:hypothetical protein